MNQEVEIFQHGEFGSVRVVEENGGIYFVAADVCKALEIKNARDAVANLDDDEKGVANIYTPGGYQNMATVNESGLYALVLKSRKPNAKKFRKWLTGEVVPSIRQNGVYLTADAAEKILYNPDFIIRLAQRVKDLQTEVALLKPKADYCDDVLTSDEPLTFEMIAKDYGRSGKWIVQAMIQCDLGFRRKEDGQFFFYQKYAKLELTTSGTITLANGRKKTVFYPNQKARELIYRKFKEKWGLVPLNERAKYDIRLEGFY